MILSEYSGAYAAYSLRRLNSTNDAYPLIRVARSAESYTVECDVFADSNQTISFDSQILATSASTNATTLGEFLNIQHDNVDNLSQANNAKIVKIYDQANDNDYVIEATNEAFLLVEDSEILTINNKPAFKVNPISDVSNTIVIPQSTDLSLHYVSQKVNDNSYLGFKNSTYILAALTDSKSFEINSNLSINVNLVSRGLDELDLTDNTFDTNISDTSLFTVEFEKLNASTVYQFADTALFSEVILYPNYSTQRRLYIENDQAEYYSITDADNLIDTLNSNSFLAQFPNPAAAYSVRDLRGGVDDQGDRVTKIMRVRREIDHAEADVYPDSTGWLSLDSPVEIVPAITDNLEGGTGDEIDSQAVTLGEFVNDPNHNNPDNLVSATTAKVVVWYDQSDPDYLVDNLPESIQERGAPIRIRVIGGTYNNYEFDVYFDNNETISLSSYVADTYEITDSNGQVTAAISNGTLQTLLDAGMTEAAVCVWYDQSGSGNDASQDVSTAQPKIVSERTNLLLQSNTFDTTWTGLTKAGGFEGYDGSNDGWKITKPAQPYTFIQQSITLSDVWTLSVYAKSDTLNGITFRNQTDATRCDFDLLNGVVGYSHNNVITKSIQDVGNGWYRCQATFTGSSSGIAIYIAWNDATAGSVFIQDAQLETGSSATDYIETTTSAVSVSELITESGKPAIQTDGSDDAMTLASTINFTDLTWFTVTKKDDTDGNGSIIFYGSNSYAGDDVDNTGNPKMEVPAATVLRYDTLGNTSASGGEINQHLSYYNRNGTNASGGLNGEVNTEATVATTAFNLAQLFQYGSSFNFEGLVQELVLYDSNKKSDRTGIETNINDYYDIYGSGNTGVNIKLLDDGFYPDAAAAYSLRKLRTAYGGPVNLSGRKDAKQQVSTAQPTIYNNGLVIIDGNPSVQFDGVNDGMDMNHADLYGQSRLDSFTHYQSDDNLHVLYHDDTGGGGRYSFISFDGSTNTTLISQYGASPDLYINGSQVTIYGTTTRDDLHTAIVTNGVSAISGALETHLNASTTEWNAFGVSVYNGIRLNGKIAEMIFYNTPQDDNRIDIENNINSAFQIYAANFSSVLDTVPSAKAAYSIRRLTKEYINPIITVSNGSTTKDFYADFWGNLNVDALTSFANGGTLSVTKWWDQSGNNYHLLGEYTNKPTLTVSNGDVSVNTTNKFTLPLLDRYSGAAAAYSLRELSSSYTGPLVRVRRDGTNTEVDVYPDANGQLSLDSTVSDVAESTTGVTVTELETSATNLGQFVADAGYSNPDGLGGTVNAFVVVWYDQSNSNDASQDVSTSQPKIYAAGTNLLLQSNQFDTSPWTFNGALTGGQTGYDGTSDAWLISNFSTTSPLGQPATSSGVQTFSAYFKKNPTYGIRLYIFGTINTWTWFDLNTGTPEGSGGSYISSSVEAVGSDWWRCSMTFDTTVTYARFYVTDNAGTQVLGSVTIQDAQLVPSDTVTDYVETTTSAISQGALITENGKSAVDFDGSDDGFVLDTSSLDIGSLSSFAIGKMDTTTGTQMMLGLSGTSGDKRWFSPYVYQGNFNYSYGNSVTAVSATANTNTNLHTMIAGSTLGQMQAWLNSSSVGTLTLTSGIYSTQSGIMNLAGGLPANGKMQEIVIYDSDQSTNRTGIEENINDYYQISNFNTTASTAQTVAVYSDAINETFDLNTTYTDLKEIIIYE